MENGFIDKVYATVEKKEKMIDRKFTSYAIRAMMAGIFLTIVYTFCMQIVTDFSGTEVAPFGKMLMSYLFGIGLLFIIYFGAELFTSNTMYFSVGTTHKKSRFSKAMKVLVFCWIFNLVGAAFCAFLMVNTGLFTAVDGAYPNDALYTLAAKKATLSSSEIFFRGILANFVVNVVMFISIVVKDDVAKLLIVPLGLAPFVYLGFEHSIANMGVFCMTWLTPDAAATALYHEMPFTNIGALNNLLWSTLGNIVGGGVMVGGYFAFLNKHKIKEEQEKKAIE